MYTQKHAMLSFLLGDVGGHLLKLALHCGLGAGNLNVAAQLTNLGHQRVLFGLSLGIQRILPAERDDLHPQRLHLVLQSPRRLLLGICSQRQLFASCGFQTSCSTHQRQILHLQLEL